MEGEFRILFYFEIYCSSMYETPKSEIKFGGHRPRCPATDPGKNPQFYKLSTFWGH